MILQGINELKEAKEYLKTVRGSANLISPNMYEFMSDLHNYFPYCDKEIVLPEKNIQKQITEIICFMY